MPEEGKRPTDEDHHHSGPQTEAIQEKQVTNWKPELSRTSKESPYQNDFNYRYNNESENPPEPDPYNNLEETPNESKKHDPNNNNNNTSNKNQNYNNYQTEDDIAAKNRMYEIVDNLQPNEYNNFETDANNKNSKSNKETANEATANYEEVPSSRAEIDDDTESESDEDEDEGCDWSQSDERDWNGEFQNLLQQEVNSTITILSITNNHQYVL